MNQNKKHNFFQSIFSHINALEWKIFAVYSSFIRKAIIRRERRKEKQSSKIFEPASNLAQQGYISFLKQYIRRKTRSTIWDRRWDWQKTTGLCLIGILILFFFLHPGTASAVDHIIEKGIAIIVGNLIGLVVELVGTLDTLLIKTLIFFATYNNFVNHDVVRYGWTVVRDFCNMFFIFLLLIIAFGTILNLETYSYKRLLPNLIIFAILINFSKTITGILIDFGQVIMLTFVSAFASTGESNFLIALNLGNLTGFAPAGDITGDNTLFKTVVGYIFAGLMVVITLAIMLILTMFLAWRIVQLWVLIILSPAAYLTYILPFGKAKQFATRWWSELGENITNGPVLAFFLWLALVIAGNPNGLQDFSNVDSGSAPIAGVSAAGTWGDLQRFIISTALLLTGLKVAQEVGGMGGNLAGKLSGKVGAFALGAWAGAKWTGKGALAAPMQKMRGRGFWEGFTQKGRGEAWGMFKAGTKQTFGQTLGRIVSPTRGLAGDAVRKESLKQENVRSSEIKKEYEETGSVGTEAERIKRFGEAKKMGGSEGVRRMKVIQELMAEKKDESLRTIHDDFIKRKDVQKDIHTIQGQSTAAFSNRLEDLSGLSGLSHFRLDTGAKNTGGYIELGSVERSEKRVRAISGKLTAAEALSVYKKTDPSMNQATGEARDPEAVKDFLALLTHKAGFGQLGDKARGEIATHAALYLSQADKRDLFPEEKQALEEGLLYTKGDWTRDGKTGRYSVAYEGQDVATMTTNEKTTGAKAIVESKEVDFAKGNSATQLTYSEAGILAVRDSGNHAALSAMGRDPAKPAAARALVGEMKAGMLSLDRDMAQVEEDLKNATTQDEVEKLLKKIDVVCGESEFKIIKEKFRLLHEDPKANTSAQDSLILQMARKQKEENLYNTVGIDGIKKKVVPTDRNAMSLLYGRTEGKVFDESVSGRSLESLQRLMKGRKGKSEKLSEEEKKLKEAKSSKEIKVAQETFEKLQKDRQELDRPTLSKKLFEEKNQRIQKLRSEVTITGDEDKRENIQKEIAKLVREKSELQKHADQEMAIQTAEKDKVDKHIAIQEAIIKQGSQEDIQAEITKLKGELKGFDTPIINYLKILENELAKAELGSIPGHALGAGAKRVRASKEELGITQQDVSKMTLERAGNPRKQIKGKLEEMKAVLRTMSEGKTGDPAAQQVIDGYLETANGIERDIAVDPAKQMRRQLKTLNKKLLKKGLNDNDTTEVKKEIEIKETQLNVEKAKTNIDKEQEIMKRMQALAKSFDMLKKPQF